MNQVSFEKYNQPKVNTGEDKMVISYGFSKYNSRYKNKVVRLKDENLVDYNRRHKKRNSPMLESQDVKSNHSHPEVESKPQENHRNLCLEWNAKARYILGN